MLLLNQLTVLKKKKAGNL